MRINKFLSCRKGSSEAWLPAVVVGGLFLFILIFAQMFGLISFAGVDDGGGPNNQTTTTTTQPPYSPPVQDIGNIFHVWVDPIYPAGLNNSRVLCLLSGGEWMDEVDGIGCFDMPTGTYNASLCLTDPTIQYFEYTCVHGISDGEWVCNDRNIGCRREGS